MRDGMPSEVRTSATSSSSGRFTDLMLKPRLSLGRAAIRVEVAGDEGQALALGKVEDPRRQSLAQGASSEAVALEQIGQFDARPPHGHAVGPLARHDAGHQVAHDPQQTGPGPVLGGRRESDPAPSASHRACAWLTLDGAVADEQPEQPHEIVVVSSICASRGRRARTLWKPRAYWLAPVNVVTASRPSRACEGGRSR